MRLLKQIAPLLASLALPVAAQAAPGPADVAAMRTYVERNLAYRPAARAEALRRVALLPGLYRNPARFELEAAGIAALADNGHSALLPPQWPSRYRRSPVHLGLFADGLYVVSAPPDRARLVGRRVLRVNGRDWRVIRAAYARYQGGLQSFRDQFVPLFMEMPALLAAAGFGPDPDRVAYTLAARTGRPETVVVQAVLAPYQGDAAFTGRSALLDGAGMLPAERIPLYLRAPDRIYRLAFPARIDGAYVQLKAVRGLGIAQFFESTLEELRRRRPRNIVVDLRFNIGGDLNIARDFMQALPGIAQDRVYAITSGRTFSAAISSLGYLKQAAGDRLTIVGEPIGDRLEFWAEGDIMTLPGLGAMLLYANERHNYMTGCPEQDCHGSIREHPIRVRSLQPDIPAALTWADFQAGRDPAMAAIARDIGRRRYAPAVSPRG
ncbi:MAG TPA: hypothetical protein VEC11_00285 [Allosphingosinicella sp.]|nr:hypothetical protein [Allosphingosinicella sp.]